MTIKVSKNDATLAHNLAKSQITQAAEHLMSGRGLRLMGANSVKQFIKGVELLFPGRIIDAAIDRVIGSRARAAVVVADTDTGGNVALSQLIFSAKLPPGHRVTPHAVPLIVQKHAVGRVMQRVTGNNDFGAAITAIQPYIHNALIWVAENYPLQPDLEVQVSGQGLEVSGSVDEAGRLRLKTVITLDSMSSELRRAWAMSDEIKLRVRSPSA